MVNIKIAQEIGGQRRKQGQHENNLPKIKTTAYQPIQNKTTQVLTNPFNSKWFNTLKNHGYCIYHLLQDLKNS
jgi:phage antirepressor YoqD-like protein